MTVVNIAELKNQLSHFLRLVRKGGTVLVRDRDRLIARIEPAGSRGGSADDRLSELEMRGVLKPGQGSLTAKLFVSRPKCRGDAVSALLKDRREGP